MRKRLVLVTIAAAVLVLASAAVVIVNQSFQLMALAERFHPAAADAVFWMILVLFGFSLLVPLYLFLTLPAPLIPPPTAEGAPYDKHLGRLRKRLARNPHLTGKLEENFQIQEAIAQLDAIAEARTRATASQVFMTTAISQNGSLDALLVLTAQTKLVFEIARIYYQRPTVWDMLYLYSNVAATAFIAGEIEDIDISHQLQPIVTAVLGSTVAAIPGVTAAATLFVNSVSTGAANAYLTLRVGIIAREYCRSLVRPHRRAARHAAALRAAKALGGITRDGAAAVAAAVFARPKKYFSELISAASGKMAAFGDAAAGMSAAAWQSVTGRKGPAE